jgi:spoIIIJ-associated protein
MGESINMENRTHIEIIAPSPEEAIEEGLQELGLSEEDVQIEILDEGSKGLFGIGSRQSRVKLTVLTPSEVDEHTISTESLQDRVALEDGTQPVELEPTSDTISLREKPATDEDDVSTSSQETEAVDIAAQTVQELLEKMSIKAEVSASLGFGQEIRGRTPICVDINGNDLSILIGRQAETLNALQYITSLIVGKELNKSIPIIVDVEGYRKRREKQLRGLARRMAEQAVNTGRKQLLEPMPANERRLIHIELRDNPNVITESVGEDPRRKVTIMPVS